MKSASPTRLFGSGPNVIVWAAFGRLMLNDCDAGVAALKLASPACEALIMQVPIAVR